MSDLSEFLLARIAEDEALAKSVHATGVERGNDPDEGLSLIWDDWGAVLSPPARILAECSAKRRIVEAALLTISLYGGGTVLDLAWETMRLLTLPYADHPDYDQAWRP